MKLLQLAFFMCVSSGAYAQFPNPSQEFVKSKDSPEIAMCTAASLQMQTSITLYSTWFDILKQRYTVIYPQKTAKQVEAYTIERVLDKKRRLKDMGYDSKSAALKYFQVNCTP